MKRSFSTEKIANQNINIYEKIAPEKYLRIPPPQKYIHKYELSDLNKWRVKESPIKNVFAVNNTFENLWKKAIFLSKLPINENVRFNFLNKVKMKNSQY